MISAHALVVLVFCLSTALPQEPAPTEALQDPAETPEEPAAEVEGVEEGGDGAAPAATPAVPVAIPELPERAAREEGVARDYLAALAEARPGDARLEVLGRSRAGREIPLLVVGAAARVEASEADPGPALLFASYRSASPGADAALAVARRAVEAAGDPATAELFGRVTLYVAPLLDPDADHAAADGPDEVADFDHDFPIGWLPGSLRPGAVDVPLSRPATEAAARFLDEHSGLALVLAPVAAERVGGRPWPQAELPAVDRGVLDALAAGADDDPAPLVGWNALASAGGGFLDHAYQAHGVLPLAFPEPGGGPEAPGVPRWSRAVAERVLALAARLPDVTVREEHIERLGPSLWRLDVVVANRGGLPSQSALAGGRPGAAGELRLVLRGARVLATARGKGSADAPYRVAEPSVPEGREVFAEAALGPGEERCLRFVLRGEAGDQVELSAATERAGRAVLRVPLR